jgi:hypothetical protein
LFTRLVGWHDYEARLGASAGELDNMIANGKKLTMGRFNDLSRQLLYLHRVVFGMYGRVRNNLHFHLRHGIP